MPPTPDYLAPWMTAQRWFGGKGRSPQLRIIGEFSLAVEPGVGCSVYLVLDESEHPVLYQVPLTMRAAPLAGADSALVAERDGVWIYDGPHDRACAAAILRLILDGGSTIGPADTTAAFGHRDSDSSGALTVVASKVLTGEQSNTSIVFQTVDAAGDPGLPIICKVFRAVHDGENPDVVLTGALGAAGSRVAPRSVGHIVGRWPDTGIPDGAATGHLAFAQEFLPGVEDAWRVATAAASRNDDFAAPAAALGVITAEMHAELARAFPSRPTIPADIALVVTAMRQRFDVAVHEVAGLERHRGHLNGVYQRAAASPWPALQRIHGDFHLGQVLAVPERGWVVLDFEGEPLRAMRERTAPDSPLRDVAGMLRSFDYVAGSLALATPDADASEWASRARNAFLDAYISASGRDLRAHRALLDAFEIDKALYEAIYESRNRPAWLPIPLAAIQRLVERPE